MGVTKTQVVKFIRKGDKGDAGENGITISLLPAALTPKVGVSSTLRVQVALYDGGRLIGYNDETDGNMLCSTLPTSSAYKWTFRVESGKFYFVIMITPTDTTAISLPFTITYKGAKYDSVITIQPVANGAQGKQGATLRGPQAWSDCANGYSFQAGGDGDSWKDVVIYKDNYYSCIKSHTKTADNYPGSTAANNNKYWQLGDKIELVASKILLATYALVKNLGVEAIDMKDASGNIVFQAKDGNVICKNGTFIYRNTCFLCRRTIKNERRMQKETVTFDKLPEAVGYLTEQVIELKRMVSELQPPTSDKHVLVEIEDACRIIRKARPTIYTLVRKGLLPAYKKGKKLYFYGDELLTWIENGRRKTSEQTYEEMLANM